MMNEDKQPVRLKAIEAAFAAIEKQYGKGSIMRLDERPAFDIVTSPSGSLALDIALGTGGFPRGRIVEVYGGESSGKTTLCLHALAACQREGGVAAFVDAEHALDVSYARRIGVNTSELLVSQPDFGEQALEIVDMLVRSGAVDIIVVDSVAALVPKAEIEGEMGDSHVGLQARLMSQALRKLTASISRSNCIVIFINQIRMKIGVMFGNPETTTGGNALKFYSSVRLEVRRAAAIKNGNDAIGNRTRVKVVKNKVAAPFKECEFDVMFGTGVSREGEILDIGAELEIIDKAGTWFAYENERLGQGRENSKDYLRDHPETRMRIEKAIYEKLGFKAPKDIVTKALKAPAASLAANATSIESKGAAAEKDKGRVDQKDKDTKNQAVSGIAARRAGASSTSPGVDATGN
jgi:recombination protein RecA